MHVHMYIKTKHKNLSKSFGSRNASSNIYILHMSVVFIIIYFIFKMMKKLKCIMVRIIIFGDLRYATEHVLFSQMFFYVHIACIFDSFFTMQR